MWRKTKKDTSVSDAPYPPADSHSPKGGHSHRLARVLLRPFSRKSHGEESPRRTRSDTQLLGQKPGQDFRLSRSSLDETRPVTGAGETSIPGLTASEAQVPGTRVTERRVTETRLGESRVTEPRVGETRVRGNMELAPRVEVRDVQKVAAVQPATSKVGTGPIVGVKTLNAADVNAAVERPAADIGPSTAGASPLTPGTSTLTPGAHEGMSEQMVSELTSAFKYFDHNSDGSIDQEELGAVLRSLGDHPSDEELEAMIAAVDQNGDGSICLSEFLALNKRAMEAGLGADDDRELRATFDVFDLDGNGFISCEELQQVLSNLLGEPVVKADCFRMIQGVDKDGDGQVNFQEFHTMMQQAMPC